MNELKELLKDHTASKEGFLYWVMIAQQFLERYDIELGLSNAYGGHLAILLEKAYEKGQRDEQQS